MTQTEADTVYDAGEKYRDLLDDTSHLGGGCLYDQRELAIEILARQGLMLRRLEWICDGGHCPRCDGRAVSGHEPECDLAKLIKHLTEAE